MMKKAGARKASPEFYKTAFCSVCGAFFHNETTEELVESYNNHACPGNLKSATGVAKNR